MVGQDWPKYNHMKMTDDMAGYDNMTHSDDAVAQEWTKDDDMDLSTWNYNDTWCLMIGSKMMWLSPYMATEVVDMDRIVGL